MGIPQGDFERAVARMGGDREMYAEILQFWLKTLESAEGDLRVALASGQETAERFFHSLKSAAAAVGAEELSAYAAGREELLRGAVGPFDPAQFAPEFSALVTEAHEVTVQYLEAHRA